MLPERLACLTTRQGGLRPISSAPASCCSSRGDGARARWMGSAGWIAGWRGTRGSSRRSRRERLERGVEGQGRGRRPRVLLADNQELFLEGLRRLLADEDFEVVGVAQDGLEALNRVRALRPDIVLMEVDLPRCDGLEATRLITAEMPQVKVVMLAVPENDDLLFEAVRSGASGFLPKSVSVRGLLGALHGLGRGEPALPRGMVSRILNEFARRAREEDGLPLPIDGPEARQEAIRSGPAGLVARRLQVLTLAARGLTYREIGNALGLSEPTVKYHMRRIVELLQVRNRFQAIACLQQAPQWAAKGKAALGPTPT